MTTLPEAIQFGETLYGESDELFGKIVVISENGNRIAASFGGNKNGELYDLGGFRVYEKGGSGWTKGIEVDGTSGSLLGTGFSMSNDGALLAASSSKENYVNLYNLNTTLTTEFKEITDDDSGSTTNLNTNRFFGDKIALSGDGTHLAVYTPKKKYANDVNNGQVDIYSKTDSAYVHFATILSGAGNNFWLSWSDMQNLTLNTDGTRLGLVQYPTTTTVSTKLVIYNKISNSYDVSDTIIISNDSKVLAAIAMNGDGSIVAFGLEPQDTTTTVTTTEQDYGKVCIYELNTSTNTYQQMGSTIYGLADEPIASCISLNLVGDRIAIGSSGNVKIYDYTNNDWAQSFATLKTSENIDYGKSIALSGNGLSLIVGAYTADKTITTQVLMAVNGYVEIYDLMIPTTTLVTTSPGTTAAISPGATLAANNPATTAANTAPGTTAANTAPGTTAAKEEKSSISKFFEDYWWVVLIAVVVIFGVIIIVRNSRQNYSYEGI
jgi:hypothetical protein